MSDINLKKKKIQLPFEEKIEQSIQQNIACNRHLQGACFERYAISNGLIFGYGVFQILKHNYKTK